MDELVVGEQNCFGICGRNTIAAAVYGDVSLNQIDLISLLDMNLEYSTILMPGTKQLL